MLIIGLFILQSCLFSNCNEINLSKDDRKWSQCYEYIDTILFSSDENELDTFILRDKYEDYTTCSKFELGPDVYNYYGVEFLQSGKSNKLNNKICLSLEKDFQHGADTECIKSFQVLDLSSTFDNSKDTNLVINYINMLAFNTRPIKTFYFELGDHFSDNSSNKILSFNWSPKYGLVRYKLKNGKTFNLLKKKITGANTRLAKKPKSDQRKTIKYKIYELCPQIILILKFGFFARRQTVMRNSKNRQL